MRTLCLVVGVIGVARPTAGQVLHEAQRREQAREHYTAGEERMAREAFEEAVGEFRAATALAPDFFLAHYGLGQAHTALKQYPQAVTAYQGARDCLLRQSSMDQRERAEIDKRRRDEIRELEDSLQRLRSGQIKNSSPGQELAMEDRIRVLKDADRGAAGGGVRVPAELSVALGSAHFRLGELGAAEKEYRAAVTTDPKHGGAHNNLAVVLMRTERFEEARQELERAEKAGFRVSPQLKKDLEERLSARKK